jgi:phosphoglycerate dehydrogenase-like enzyme
LARRSAGCAGSSSSTGNQTRKWPDPGGVARRLNGSTVGIVGLGRVGRCVINFLKPFGVRILGYDAYVSTDSCAQPGIERTDLETLLSTADVVTLHMAVASETRGMLGALSLMKTGAVFVNCARAALVNGESFRQELAKKRFTAYLDVFEPEPPAPDDILRKLDNVVMTPHVADSTDIMFWKMWARGRN